MRPILLHGEEGGAWPVLALAGAPGLDTRIGLKGTLLLPNGSRAHDNAELIRAACEVPVNRSTRYGLRLPCRSMSAQRRLILTGTAIVPGLALVLLRMAGWFGWFNHGTIRLAGFASPDATDADSATIAVFGRAAGSDTDWAVSAYMLIAALAVIGLAVYFGLAGLDASRGAVGGFVLGWGATALAAAAAEVAFRQTAASNGVFGPGSFAPLTGDHLMPGSTTLTYGYGMLLGWLVGLALAVAFSLTRPSRSSITLSA